MSQRDPKALYDGFTSLEGGMNSGLAPHLIQPNQAAKMVNVTIRGAYPTTRPGWKKIPLNHEGEHAGNQFETGKFQGASTFCRESRNREIVVAVSGRLWRIRPNGDVKSLVTWEDRRSSILPQVWMEQVEDTLVVQDGQDKPWLYSGASLRKAEWDEVPGGKSMSYTNGRLWVTLPDDRSFVAGDLLGTDTGPLKFTENTYLAEGGAFAVPSSAGRIVGMQSTALPDASLGEGELLVICENAVYAVNVPFDRTAWASTTYPIIRALIVSSGGVGGWSSECVNSDVFFRSRDGLRSVVRAQRDFASWGNTPLSTEMSLVFNNDSPHLLGLSSMTLFDNRLLITYGAQKRFVNGTQVTSRQVVHEGLVVLEFDSISGMGTKAAPAYAGTWKRDDVGILKVISGVFDGVHRCFVLGLDETGRIALYEITKDERFDDGDQRIESSIETRAVNFGSQWSHKELAGGDVGVCRLAGTVNFTIEYRPDQYETDCAIWRPWHTWSETATYQDCVLFDGTCKPTTTYKEQYRPRKMLPTPDVAANTAVSKPFRLGNDFQARLTWEGHAQIRRLVMKAYETQEDVTARIT